MRMCGHQERCFEKSGYLGHFDGRVCRHLINTDDGKLCGRYNTEVRIYFDGSSKRCVVAELNGLMKDIFHTTGATK